MQKISLNGITNQKLLIYGKSGIEVKPHLRYLNLAFWNCQPMASARLRFSCTMKSRASLCVVRDLA
jgi:hypothetical protein